MTNKYTKDSAQDAKVHLQAIHCCFLENQRIPVEDADDVLHDVLNPSSSGNSHTTTIVTNWIDNTNDNITRGSSQKTVKNLNVFKPISECCNSFR